MMERRYIDNLYYYALWECNQICCYCDCKRCPLDTYLCEIRSITEEIREYIDVCNTTDNDFIFEEYCNRYSDACKRLSVILTDIRLENLMD